MNKQQRKRIIEELSAKTHLTREQYESFCGLADDLDLSISESDDWDDIINTL